jgi:chromosome segregation ATPase
VSDFQTPPPGYPPPQPPPTYSLPPQNSGGGGGIKFAILFGAVIALLAANVYLFLQIDSVKQELVKTNQAITDEMGRVRESQSVSAAAARKNIEMLQDELEGARRQAQMSVGQAKVDAQKHAEDLARRLEQQQKAAEQSLRTEVSKVEANATNKIGEVSSEVSNVKSDVASTKSELDKTIAELRSTRGDLGVQSGLIATNGRELAALKALGERNYFEFNLAKSKTPQRVGDIMVQLKKTDPKRYRYTIDVVADDKKIEKKDKNINEPVQFYTSRARQPYELVVNEVKKDLIIGYLSTPKVQTGR